MWVPSETHIRWAIINHKNGGFPWKRFWTRLLGRSVAWRACWRCWRLLFPSTTPAALRHISRMCRKGSKVSHMTKGGGNHFLPPSSKTEETEESKWKSPWGSGSSQAYWALLWRWQCFPRRCLRYHMHCEKLCAHCGSKKWHDDRVCGERAGDLFRNYAPGENMYLMFALILNF